jgi:hypothetical protein
LSFLKIFYIKQIGCNFILLSNTFILKTTIYHRNKDRANSITPFILADKKSGAANEEIPGFFI